MLKVVLLVVCTCVAIGLVVHFFFWNRILGYILGGLLRLALWTQDHASVWVEFGSVHLSLIAGRLVFRDVRYHSSNQTFQAVKLQLSWRWWIRHATEEEDVADGRSVGSDHTSGGKPSPRCRIHISMEGFEWFMYNRMASFENILSRLSALNPELSGVRTKSRESNVNSTNRSLVRDATRSRGSLATAGRRVFFAIQRPSFVDKFFSWTKRQLPDLNPKNLLPLSLDAVKGSITLGNHTAENLLVAQFTRAFGTFGIVQSRSCLDDHKQLLRISFENAVINCVENPDYWSNSYDVGKSVKESFLQSDNPVSLGSIRLTYSNFKKLWVRYKKFFSYYKSRGGRYGRERKRKEKEKKTQEETSHVGADFSRLEYAMDRRLLETTSLELVYYADVAGLVPRRPIIKLEGGVHSETRQSKELEFMDIGNGDFPPEWGVDIVVHGGSIHYGPWADRQRAQLQRIFFPPTFQINELTTMLSPGDQRTCTCLKLIFEFRGVTTLLLPFREASKNWQWDGVVDIPHLRKHREAASIQVRLGDKSTLKYLVPMVATAQGYTAEADAFMDSISVTSSLNDIRLLEADSCSISSLLPSPLQWNVERSWDFEFSLDRPIIYIIRDHINMLTDLGKDWASGPPHDFNTFVPITYSLKLILHDFELNLYANDHNIIDRPLDRRDNVLFTLRGDVLNSVTSIPSTKFRPLSTEVTFSISSPDVALSMTLPRWNTHALEPYSIKSLTNFGNIGLLRLDGSYAYHAEVRKDCIDRLKLSVELPSPSFKIFGWLIRHGMVLRDNYFGGFTQYSTTREYLNKRENGIPVGDPLELKYRPGKNNVFHFDLSLIARSVTVVLPAGTIGFEKAPSEFGEDVDIGSCAIFTIPELQILLRLHDFSMEMSLNADPMALAATDCCLDSLLFSHSLTPPKQQLSISGISVTANRLFGPQPRTSTYVCIWNISVGGIKGALGTKDAELLTAVGRSFGHGFTDPFNTPSSDYMIPPERDATFWNVNVNRLDVSWRTAPAIVRLCLTEGLRFAYNNLAGDRYRKLIGISVPVAELQMLLSPSTAKYWLEVGRVRTSLSAEFYFAPKGWCNDAKKQKVFLQAQDAETRRFASLFREQNDTGKWSNGIYLQSVRAPSVSSLGVKRRPQSVALSAAGQWLRSKTFSESESDGERRMTEADRDRRLADSRPRYSTAPRNQNEDGDSSSLLDESDETDNESSDDSMSDYFEFGGDGHCDPRLPYLSLCRKVHLRRADTESNCRTDFIVGKEAFNIQEPLFSPEPTSIKDPHEMPMETVRESEPDAPVTDAEGRRYIRLDIKDTKLFVTTLCFLAAVEVLEQYDLDELSPELRLDKLMLERIGAVVEVPISVCDVRLRSMGIYTVHRAADLTRVQSVREPLRDEHHAFVVTRMDAKEARILLGMAPTGGSGVSLDYGKFSVHRVLGSVGSLYTSSVLNKRESRAPSSAIEFNTRDFLVEFTKPRCQVSYETSELKLFRTAPEVSIVAVTALRAPFKGLSDAQQRGSSLARLKRKQLICSILTRCASTMSKDLLSSVQPAFFVQSGRPDQLRGDTSWKLLFLLRHSLSGMSREDYGALWHDALTVATVEDADKILLGREVPWAMEGATPLARIELVDSLLRGKPTESDASIKRNDSKPVGSGGFRANVIRLTIVCDDAPPSSLVIRDLNLRANILRRRVLFEAVSLSPYSSTIRSFRPTSNYVNYGSLSAVLALDIDAVQVTVFPNVIGFLQNAVHVWRVLLQPTKPRTDDLDAPGRTQKSSLADFLHNRLIAFDVRLVLNHMLVEAAAENIVFEVTSKRCSLCFVSHVTQPLDTTLDVSVNYTIGFREFAVKARTRSFSDKDMDTLASIAVVDGTWCLLFQNHTPNGSSLRGTLHATSFDISIPKSAIRLYQFIEQWRQDYLISLDTMLRSLFAEIKQTPERLPRQPSATKPLGIHLSASLSAASVILQVMHGTWLAWTTYGVVGYLIDRPNSKNVTRACGLQLASQVVRLTSTSSYAPPQRLPKIVLDLPSIRASGSFSSERKGLLISVGFLEVKIKPTDWDSLLSVQQKFGQDFNDLILILEDAKNKLPSSGRRKGSSTKTNVPFYVTAKFEGFKIGLQGPSSTQFLECVDIDAMIYNKGTSHWHVNLTDLALYLSPRSLARQKLAEVDRTQLPALISVNVQASNHTSIRDPHRRLGIDVTKFHAILQAHLIGSIGDFVDHLQSELMVRKERRAAELKEIKEKAMRVMKTFNLDPRGSSVAKRENLLDNLSVAISMANFGAAFPLDLERKKVPKFGSDGRITTKALLLSIGTFKFETQRGQSGDAFMEGFCLQFVSKFDPSNPDDFSARRHHTLNQMLYPDMTARVRTDTSSSSRQIFASASVSGFILDLDPSITSYVFSLIDAYRHGKERVEQLSVGIPRTPVEASSVATSPKASNKESRGNTITSRIEASLEFMSGTVRMHCTSKDASAFSSISPDWPGNTYQILDSDAVIFRLPGLSVAAEYYANAAQLRTPGHHDVRSPIVAVRSTVHSSRNALRPLVLSFVSGIVHNIEERMKQVSHTPARSPTSVRHSLSTLSVGDSDAGAAGLEDIAPSSLQFFISLRIDKSRLELTCRPDVNVIAGVNWESGGFILNVGPGEKGISLSASIEGLTIGLKHGFLSEDSAHFDARNLLFTINFSKSNLSKEALVNSISVVVDTEFSGGLRFSRFQDLLCFKAVWLDHIPILKGDTTESSISPSKLSAVSSLEQAPKQGFDTAIVVHVRRIALEVDLGQSISNITLDLQTTLNRIRLTPARSEIYVSFSRVDMQARGNLSGHLKMPDFVFRTVRRRQMSTIDRQPLSRMLELNLTSGTLDIQLQSDWLWLLQYRAEPLEARIYDDWTVDFSSSGAQKRQLHLYSSLSGSEVVAMMTIMAIPKLMMYGAKLRSSLEAQRDGASRESSAFRSTRLPKPDNALSEVANAMFRSARSKLKETESLSYEINQHMRLELKELVFVVLPRSQGDTELARVIGRDIMAQLDRTVQHIALPAHRDLRLSLSYLSISQLLKQGFDPHAQSQELDALLTSGKAFSGSENAIFSLPAMDMRMVTDERMDDSRKILPYDFFSNFARRDGQKGEDIHISFNIRLYSWLTALRKTFTRELKRAQEAIDTKATKVSPTSAAAPKLAGPDFASSPFAYGSEDTYSPTYSPSGSSPSSRQSSRPSSPARSRSRDSVIITTPSKGLNTPITLASPGIQLLDSSKHAEGSVDPNPAKSPPASGESGSKSPQQDSATKKTKEMTYLARSRKIERLTVRQLGEATPDVMHPFITKKAGFNLEESLPQYVHEYATVPIEEIMKGLVKVYSKQLD